MSIVNWWLDLKTRLWNICYMYKYIVYLSTSLTRVRWNQNRLCKEYDPLCNWRSKDSWHIVKVFHWKTLTYCGHSSPPSLYAFQRSGLYPLLHSSCAVLVSVLHNMGMFCFVLHLNADQQNIQYVKVLSTIKRPAHIYKVLNSWSVPAFPSDIIL